MSPALQAIQDIIIQIFYNAHITDPEKSDSLLKVRGGVA